MIQGRGLLNNEWMTINAGTIGPEYGIGHPVGNAVDAPVMILKSCIGNRSLGWDLLPPGSERYEVAGFFFWQGEKDGGNPAHAAKYEENLVRFIKRLRQDFDAPDAKFRIASSLRAEGSSSSTIWP